LIIQHAERFGLAQLHQMRGRVGRGKRKGVTIAVAYPPISNIARKRLEYFTSTNDGFKIAEADLELRGPGEFSGLRQHGLSEFRMANPITDLDLLKVAQKWAVRLMHEYNQDSQETRFLLNQFRLFSNIRPELMDVA